MVSLLVTSIGSGRAITRTGRYKIFPIIGLFITGVGLALMSLMDVHTSLAVSGVYMLVTGLGTDMVMPVLVLATQNAVEHKDLGVATSGATFFRSLGGALGVAVFGALLTHRLRDTIPAQLTAAGVPPEQIKGGGLSRLGTPDAINHLAEPIHTAITSGFAEALQTVFLAAVPLAVLGALVLLFLREIPLRTTQHSDTEALTLAFETGVDPDAEFTDDTTPGVDGSPKGQPSGDRAALGRPEIPGGG